MYHRLTEELVKDGRHHLKMNGREVFKQAVKRFPSNNRMFGANNIAANEIDLFLPSSKYSNK